MFSYRHAFHAGNHADVLKHVVLVQTLVHACQKEAPVFYIDTHAGAGVYALDGKAAMKNAEFASGIARLWHEAHLPDSLAQYLSYVRALNMDGKLAIYPGSPFIADAILRSQDRLRLFELHPAEIGMLDRNMTELARDRREQGLPPVRGKRTIVERKDGFAALKAQLPPPSRRAVVLIDPPYEDKADYRKVVEALQDAIRRFPTGTYLVWYPVLQRPESRRFAAQLKQAVSREWLHVTLRVASPVPDGTGFVASGLFVVNPPWKLAESLKEALPLLVRLLQKDAGAGFTLEAGAAVSSR